MPRHGYSSWIDTGSYGSRQRNAMEYIMERFLGESCKETYSLMELRNLAKEGGASAPTFYRVLRKMEELKLVELIKDEKTCRVTVRNLLYSPTPGN